MQCVSVVVPTCNRASVLPRAIESVLAQDSVDVEVLVVDDGSTDETEAVVKSFNDSRVRYLAHETNRGGSAARNTGIEAATGEYVAFLDDDDEYRPGKLTKQVESLERRSDEWVATYCDFALVREGKSPTDYLPSFLRNQLTGSESESHPEGGAELIPTVLARDFPLGGASTLLVRRETVDKVGGFDPEFPRHQDVEFLIRLLKTGKIAYVDEKLVAKHDTGRASSKDVEKAKELFFSRFSSEIAAAERQGYDITGVHRFDMARIFFADGQFLKGMKHLRGAKINVPELLRMVAIGVYAGRSSRAGG